MNLIPKIITRRSLWLRKPHKAQRHRSIASSGLVLSSTGLFRSAVLPLELAAPRACGYAYSGFQKPSPTKVDCITL